LLCEGAEHPLEVTDGRVTAADFARVTGWHVEDRGLCRGEVCVPVDVEQLCRDGGVDLASAARALRRPFVAEPAARIAALGDAATDRAASLEARQAPDFALPDLDGTVHRLSDYRGRKVLLAAFASW
jgi:hypothetical protein